MKPTNLASVTTACNFFSKVGTSPTVATGTTPTVATALNWSIGLSAAG
jgi:hypothetical protein